MLKKLNAKSDLYTLVDIPIFLNLICIFTVIVFVDMLLNIQIADLLFNKVISPPHAVLLMTARYS